MGCNMQLYILSTPLPPTTTPPHHENENDHADFMVNFAEYVHWNNAAKILQCKFKKK